MSTKQWLMITASLFLSFLYYRTVFGSSSPVRVTRSAFEHLRDRGTYIICFNDTATETELQDFSTNLESKSNVTKKFVAKIIEKFSINCLTAKLSKRALHWVSNDVQHTLP